MLSDRLWRRARIGLVLVAVVGLAGIVLWWSLPRETAPRSALSLRDGQLFREGSARPFSGVIVEDWSPGRRKLEIEVRDGRVHGRTQGWYENGQLEVGEYFAHGVSQGRRTRWHPNGQKKSEVEIRAGVLTGLFREWHANGQLARETPLLAGLPEGEVRSWDENGGLVNIVEVRGGKPVSRG